MFYNYLFPQYCREKLVSVLLLSIRVIFGVLFFMHGVDKLMNFNELSQTFPDILGFGSYMTLMVAIFCEFCCSLFLIAGLLLGVMLVPMIVSMAVAFFDVHDAMFPEGELALIYLIVFCLLYATGPGRYSLDYLIDNRIRKERPGVA
ncbi:MAG TPA: DoxX family protein [Methanocorpusculum sp.]|nr:DoxX family protein [Methanocorpusculum sp.]